MSYQNPLAPFHDRLIACIEAETKAWSQYHDGSVLTIGCSLAACVANIGMVALHSNVMCAVSGVVSLAWIVSMYRNYIQFCSLAETCRDTREAREDIGLAYVEVLRTLSGPAVVQAPKELN